MTHSPLPNLRLQAVSSIKLSVPISSASSARAASRLQAQTDAMDKTRKERASRVNGLNKTKTTVNVVTPMGRAQSNPGSSSTARNITNEDGSMIPLKTRVLQLLALGPVRFGDLVARVGGDDEGVLRIVKVVGKTYGE